MLITRKKLFQMLMTAVLVVFLLYIRAESGAKSILLRNVFAAPYIKISGTQTVSDLNAKMVGSGARDFELTDDTTIRIEKDDDIEIGEIYTGTHSLTFTGDAAGNLTISEGISGNTSASNTGNIRFAGGSVEVFSTDSSQFAAVHCLNTVAVSGGKVKITANAGTSMACGIYCQRFVMTGGSLEVEARTDSSSTLSSYGLYVTGAEMVSVISGGEADIRGITTNKELSANGIYLNGPSLIISGGKIHTEGNAPSSGYKGYGILGKSDRTLTVEGGSLDVKGNNSAVSGIRTYITGNASVTANGGYYEYSRGISVPYLSVSGYTKVVANANAYGILVDKDGTFSIDSSVLSITRPEGGYIDPKGSAYESPTVKWPDGKIAHNVVIDYHDAVTGVEVAASTSEVTRGTASTVTCAAVVKGYAHDKTVTWSVAGSKSASTRISADGILSVAADETAEELTVRATSNADPGKSGVAVITLITKTETGAHMPSGVKVPDAEALTDPSTGAVKIDEASVNALPVDKSLKKIAANRIRTKGNIAKKTMRINYTKVSGAKNYIIAWRLASAKKWRYCTTGAKTSYIIKKLKSKALFEFRVAAYRDGKRGPWSNTSYRYFINTTGTVKGGSGSVTVKLKKVKGAAGYQVLYSLKKAEDSFKVKTAKGKTTIKIKGLKKGKKYYIRWRPYKTFKGHKYLGVLSSIKTVK